MGGEWDFSFNANKLPTFDLESYQKLLLEIYEKFKNVKFEETKVRWCTQKPPVDNIFLELKCPPNFISKNPCFKLFWDFSLERTENGWIKLIDGLHCKCCHYLFRKKSQAIQRKLVKSFPQHFSLSYENYEEHYFDPEDDRIVYHKACTERCANCGFCW